MISNVLLAEILQRRLNGNYNAEYGEYQNIRDFKLDSFPNKRYEFRIFAEDSDYKKSENRGALPSASPTNTYTQFINGVLKTPSASSVEGASNQTYNAAVEAHLELLIPNCDDPITYTDDNNEVTIRLQDAVSILVNSVLGLPTQNYEDGGNGITYYIAARYSRAEMGERQNRLQVGLSVVLNVYIAFSIIAMGVSSREIKLEIDGEEVYFTRISISRTSVQENNTVSDENIEGSQGSKFGISKARTTATQLIIAFSAPVRPVAFNTAMTRYLMSGSVEPMTVTLRMPTEFDQSGAGYLRYETATYNMVFAEAGVAGEENLNSSFDVRLVEEMTIPTAETE